MDISDIHLHRLLETGAKKKNNACIHITCEVPHAVAFVGDGLVAIERWGTFNPAFFRSGTAAGARFGLLRDPCDRPSGSGDKE